MLVSKYESVIVIPIASPRVPFSKKIAPPKVALLLINLEPEISPSRQDQYTAPPRVALLDVKLDFSKLPPIPFQNTAPPFSLAELLSKVESEISVAIQVSFQ